MTPAPAADDGSDGNRWAEMNRARAESMKWKLIVPLLYAPMLPLIRIGLRHKPDLRVKAYGAAIAAGLAHAGYVMGQDSSV